jgi:uncharacterized membrane protein
MLVRIASNILRVCALVALVLGVLFWVNVLPSNNMWQGIHMFFGIVVMISLWVLAIVILTAPKGRSVGLGIGALVLGIIAIIVGINQTSWDLTPTHWIIQVIHLLIGLAAIGLGEAIGGRYRRNNRLA